MGKGSTARMTRGISRQSCQSPREPFTGTIRLDNRARRESWHELQGNVREGQLSRRTPEDGDGGLALAPGSPKWARFCWMTTRSSTVAISCIRPDAAIFAASPSVRNGGYIAERKLTIAPPSRAGSQAATGAVQHPRVSLAMAWSKQ